jgi:alkanesulfonate monooxygenase SsuD/methylene tetrahydromethanopterin reductase-like flavin-dependent oxidoreductase (luciferase family)
LQIHAASGTVQFSSACTGAARKLIRLQNGPTDMQFGVFLLMASPAARPSAEIYERAIEIAQAAEELGFAKIWVAEHHFLNYSYSSRPLLLLSHLAARTRRIRLGPAIIPLSLHHPLIVAEELAAIDLLSGGRLEIGIGKGYQKYQFDRLGIDMEQAPQRYAESLDILGLALKNPEFSYQGQCFRIPPTTVFPRPLQQPIPLWIVVNTTRRETVAEAIRHGANMFTGGLEPISRLVNVRATYPDLFATAPRDIKIGTQRQVFVTDSASEAARAAEEARWHARVSRSLRLNCEQVERGIVLAALLPEEPTTELILDEFIVAGTPDRCVSQLKRIQQGLGADYFNCSVGIGDLPQAAILRSMERFSREVMPSFARAGHDA